MRRWGRWAAAAGLVAGAAGLGGVLLWSAGSPHVPSLGSGTVLVSSVPELAPFVLRDSKGGSFDNRSLWGKWSLLLFGYTHCPDVCPTDLALLNQVVRAMGAAGTRIPPQVVFISVDPQRDSPQLLGRYVPSFNPSFVGATGTDAELGALTRSLKVYYLRNTQEGPNYSVDHSAGVYLIDPHGRLRAVLQLPQPLQGLVRDLETLVKLE